MLLLATTGAGAATTAAPATAPAPPTSAPNACTDFNAYINGAWEAGTTLPPDRAGTGSFDQVSRSNDRLLETALAELTAEPALQRSPGLKLLAAYYKSGMDTGAIERAGLAAVQPWLDRIARIERAQLPALLGEMARLQIDLPNALAVSIDARDATRHVLVASQGGLGLPDRDDYTSDSAEAKRLQAAYRLYAERLLKAAGLAADAAALDALMAFEAELASSTMTRVQRRNPQAIYNPIEPKQFRDLGAGFDWAAWQAGFMQATAARTGSSAAEPARLVVVSAPELARTMARLAQDTPQGAPLATWRTYLAVRLLDATAEKLPRVLAQARFDYYLGTIRGLQAEPPRHESVLRAISGNFGQSPVGETVGELFVAKAFSATAQKRSLEMVQDIRAAMSARIAALPWMSAETKARAQAKLQNMVAQIGAPAEWRRYEGLAMASDDYAGNQLRAAAWLSAQRVAELDKPVDRLRWNTSPHIVNAFAASGNRIVFPAGILQPPFFDPNADDATNYGAIGMVIGHEITHHFDDRGRQFDAVGNLRDWWTAEDAAAYKARADRVAAFYSGYEPLPGMRLNGQQMLGENISDVSGIQIAYEGLQIALARKRKAGEAIPLVEGRTPEQRFFMAHATMWRYKTRTEALMNQIRTGQHSPSRYRVLGPLTHSTVFAQAFGCKAGDPMVAAEPIVVW